MKKNLLFLFTFIFTISNITAQINTGTLPSTLTQNFNGLSSTGSVTWTNNTTPLVGWYSTTTTLNVNTGTTNSNNVYNFGSASASDRALGALSTATTHRFGIRIKNNSLTDISSIDISFTGEQWRQNTANQTLVFEYQVGTTVTSLTAGSWTAVTALDFVSPNTGTAGALDGNLSANRTAKSSTITVTVAAGSEIMLRWTKAGTNSHGLAIDDLSITASASSSTPSANLSINSATATETSGSSSYFTLTATASSAVTGPQTVDVALTGTGLTDSDFRIDPDGTGPTAPSAITFPYTLTIANGQTTASLQLQAFDDAVYECSETATFTISNPSAGITIGSTASQNLTITDDDFPATNLSINTTTGTEAATTSITLTATTVGSVNVIGAQTFDVALSGTNVTNSDFSVTFPRTITIANGASTGTTTFTVADDILYEGPGTETATFTMAVTSACVANGTTLTQSIVITDNDPVPVINYVAFDNFNRNDNTTVGTPSSGGSNWNETEAVAGLCEIYNYASPDFNGRLDINNNNPQGKAWTYYDMSSKYSTVFSAASKTLTWIFNMAQSRPDPSGFGTSNYGAAFVLGADESDFTSATCDGYAVVLGQSGATDAVKLVRFSGGITLNSNFTDIISHGDYGDQLLRVKIEFNPCTSEWKLFLDDDGSPADDLFIFSDPTTVTTQRGSTTANNTHTSLDLKYMGCLYSYATSVGEYASFDNISIPDATTLGIYTWNGGTTDYQTSTNWTPTRTCPQTTDILQFNNGIPNTVTNVPTQTIARLTVSASGTIVNLQSAAASNILTLQGGTGTDLDVASGTQLNINGTNDFTIQLATGATGSISGNMTFSNGAHKLRSVDNQSLTFNSGAIFTAGTSFAGNAFGASTVNQPQIVFASGSTYVYQSGSNPFGSSQPNSVVLFQSGSLYKHASNSGLPSFAGRTYANFEFDFTGLAMSSISGSAATCTIGGNMTFTNGTFNFLYEQPFNITGNLNITSGDAFNYSPSVASTFNFNGGSAQTIGGSGTITFGANATLQISNNTSLTSTVNVFGIASVTAGTLTSSGNLIIENNANLLHGVGTTLGGGSVNGNVVVKRNGTTSSSVYNYWSTPIASASLGLLGGTNYLYNPANGTADFTDDNPGPDPGWAAASGSFTVGKGYAGQGPNPAVTFTGTANNGSLTAGVQYFTLVNGSTSPGVPYNLIGNPYPSNISATSFLTANNTKVTGAIYYWDDDNTGGTGYAANDYAIWNGTGSTGGGGRTPNGMIATAQGFFVQTLSGATSVSFTNAMRAATATTFFKTDEVLPQRLWLRADNGTHTNQILVGYVDGATEDMDWFYDAQKLRGNHSVSFYSLLNDTTLLGIQGLAPLNGADPAPVPLGLYAGATGQYSIYIDSIENFPSNMPINLLDADMGLIYDLRNGPYLFQTAQGEDNDRFVLFPNEIVTALDELDNLHLNVYPNPNNGTFTVMINSGIEQEINVSLFDVTGKLIMASNQAISSCNNFIALETQVAGVYMLKVETADKTYTKRIVVY